MLQDSNLRRLLRTCRCAMWPVAITGAVIAGSICRAQAPPANSAPVESSSAAAPAVGAANTKPSSAPGQTFAPAANDSVVVAFPSGQPRAPAVTGPLWNGSQSPPVSNGQPPASPRPVPMRPVIHTRGLPAPASPSPPPSPTAAKSPCASGTSTDKCPAPDQSTAHPDKSSTTPTPPPKP
jgi:hypothetical protein